MAILRDAGRLSQQVLSATASVIAGLAIPGPEELLGAAAFLVVARPAARSIIGSRAVVRAGLDALGLSDDVTAGVRSVLSERGASQYAVEALDGGGAMVYAHVPGTNGVSAAVWATKIGASGEVVGKAKQAYESTGAIKNTLKNYK
jgi:hypothetical protein